MGLSPFDLPRVCVATGATAGVEFRRVDFSWVPWWTWLVLVCNVVLYLIVAGMTRRHVRGELPFTDEAWRRWRFARIVFRIAFVAMLVGFGLGFVLMARGDAGWAVLVFLASLVGPVGAHRLLVRPRGPVCERIEPDRLVLALPSANAASAFEGSTGRRGGVCTSFRGWRRCAGWVSSELVATLAQASGARPATADLGLRVSGRLEAVAS